MGFLETVDPQVAELIDAERRRQSDTLEMIASENHTSAAVLQAMGSVLTDKYAEGYPHKRYYCGNTYIDDLEDLCIARAKQLFSAEHANVQPHSGTSANLAVYMAALKPGDKIMGMDLDHGGHLSHGMRINISGRLFEVVSYGVRADDERMDMDEIRALALKEKPDMIVAGASAYAREIDFAAFGSIADEVGCPLLADIAHIAGLVAAGVHADPVPHAAYVTTTTHKTLRGPRSGMVLCRSDKAKKLDSAVFPGIQGGPLEHVVAAKAVAFHEALQPAFKDYAAKVVATARALAEKLMALGWRLVSDGTDNHLVLIDLRSRLPELTGKTGSMWLQQAGIICNMNKIPFDERTPMTTSGIRLGTPALTTRGVDAEQMHTVADWIDRVLTSGGEEATLEAVRGEVLEMCRAHPVPNQQG